MTGNDVIKWRDQHEWSQGEAAARLGVTRRTFQRWEADKDKSLPLWLDLACRQIDAEESASAGNADQEVPGDRKNQLDWLNGDFTRCKPRILAAIQKHGPLTRQELVEITGMPINSVCGRVRSLIDSRQLEHAYRDDSHGGFPRWKLQPWGAGDEQEGEAS